jgi:hypothetical protein
MIKVDDENQNVSVALEVKGSVGGRSQRVISTPPTMTSPTRGVTMADKSPNQHNVKKVGKSLKEKRNEKHTKKESKKGLLAE